jgi:hypothetical protein
MNVSVMIAAPLLIAAIVMTFRFVGCRFDTSGIPGPGGTGTGTPEGPPGTGTPPPHAPETTPFTMGAGSYPWPIPDWANFVDLFLLGAGGGGSGGQLLTNGDGGLGGQWNTVTLHLGVDVPETTKTITITVGLGGKGGTPLVAGTAGEATTADAAGMTTQTALGGAGGANPGSETGKGPSPASMTDTSTGDVFKAGDDQTTAGGKGIPFGGGGGGGTIDIGSGGDGADGAAWIVARQS